ncbi:T9SS type A sorting domain-containing protein [Botryobacter ruber]|uniref:T9SS type A sorting domain-containing protein n=1 Tax=Botryobacter ruber TaxID=2171629 RepID=UPI0013E3854C|nr:T9SS type A sorting domain-containing protein [Botryobacter ruber]
MAGFKHRSREILCLQNLTTALLLLTGALLLTAGSHALAQPGSNDTSFNTAETAFNPQAGFDNVVEEVVLQPDGKVVVGGNFTTFNSVSRRGIARLNADGSLDTSFNPGTGLNGNVRAIVVQPDGKIIIAGDFNFYNGATSNMIARLHPDGTLDTSFNPGGTGFGTDIYALALQSDNKIVVGGAFIAYKGVPRNRIVRLNADGSLDTTFDPGTGFSGDDSPYVFSIVLQPDNRMVVGGRFTSFNGTSRSRIARLNADGSLDTSFNPGTGFDSNVNSIALQPDDKIVVGGVFTSFNGTSRNRITRLNADGSLDTSFNPGTGLDNQVTSVELQPDGKVVLVGNFTSFNGTSRTRIARLNTDGSLDTSFDPGTGFTGGSFSFVFTVALQPNGKMVVGGAFTAFNGTTSNRIARLNDNGTRDVGGTGFDDGEVYPIVIQQDGKMVMGGNFTSFNGTTRHNITRLHPDGSLDTSFGQGAGFRGGSFTYVYSLALQPDGKIVAGGRFTSYNGTSSNRIIRLNADGTPDASFNTGTGFDSIVWNVTLQPDGKILVGGIFTSYNGTACNRIARLNNDGSLDTSFDPGTGFDGGEVLAFALQPDNKILVGGGFTSFNGMARNRIARLNANGSLDTSFDPGTGFSGDPSQTLPYVFSIVRQPDGKVVAGGGFTSFNGTARNRLARLNTNGSLDATFNPGTGFNHYVISVALQANGKLVAGGFFTSFNGTNHNHIARLNADGSLDGGFSTGTGFSGGTSPYVLSVVLQPDGKLVVGGNFLSFNTIPKGRIGRIARLHGDFICAPAPTTEPHQSFCSADNKTVADLAATGTNLKWYDAPTGGTLLPGTTVLATGTYYVSQSPDEDCESARTAVEVTIIPSPPVSVSITASPSTTIKAGTSVTFTATPVNGGTNPVYSWWINEEQVAGVTGPTYTTTTLANGNQVTCVLTSDAPCATGNPALSNLLTMTVTPADVNELPKITKFSPVSGPVGTSVTISGKFFTGTTGVFFNGVSAQFTLVDATTITTIVPAEAGSGKITVTNPTGNAISDKDFTVLPDFPAPTVKSFSPASGPVGTVVTITGTNFIEDGTVTFNGTVATLFTVQSATTIQATVPANATTGPIAVTTEYGTGTSKKSFKVTGTTATAVSLTAIVQAIEDEQVLTAYPNPFAGNAALHITLQQGGDYSVTLHDATGRLVSLLKQGTAEAGKRNTVTVDGANLPAGLYLVRLVSGEGQHIVKLVLEK